MEDSCIFDSTVLRGVKQLYGTELGCRLPQASLSTCLHGVASVWTSASLLPGATVQGLGGRLGLRIWWIGVTREGAHER
jgi:hypothetical protein